jgi:hypothetical protein
MSKGMFSISLRSRLRELVSDQQGIALPVALFAMIASMALASAAVMATVDVQQGSKRDNSSKSAIAAADAGANIARLRMNRYAYVLSTTNPCLRVGSGGQLEGAMAENGWCPAVSGTVGGSSYVYRTTPVGVACGTYNLCVVSTGTAGGVSRRIEVTYNSGTPVGGEKITEFEKKGVYNPGVNEGVISIEDLHIENADVGVNVGTNGNIIVDNNGTVCGNIRHGVGKNPEIAHKADQCSGYQITEGNITMPPVSSFMPVGIATTNSNYRLVTCTQTKPVNTPTGCQLDSYNGNRSSTSPWNGNATTKTLETSNNSSLTLSGGDYFMCKMILGNNSHLIMGAGTRVRVFFDTPEHCNLKSGAKQIDISNGADITSTGFQTTSTNFELPGFYLMGSPTIPTMIELSNNAGTNEFVLYGPNTEIVIKNNATYIGLIAGKKVLIKNNAVIKRDPRFVLSPELNPWKETETVVEKTRTTPTALYFQPQSYFECSGGAAPTGGAPNANC